MLIFDVHNMIRVLDWNKCGVHKSFIKIKHKSFLPWIFSSLFLWQEESASWLRRVDSRSRIFRKKVVMPCRWRVMSRKLMALIFGHTSLSSIFSLVLIWLEQSSPWTIVSYSWLSVLPNLSNQLNSGWRVERSWYWINWRHFGFNSKIRYLCGRIHFWN